MVHLELGRSNPGLLNIIGDLAGRFDARVIGIAACQPVRLVGGDFAGSLVSGDLIDADRTEIEKENKRSEAEFRSALQNRVESLEWRSAVMFTSLADYISREARSADVVVTAVAPKVPFDGARCVNIGDLVMQAGRPVLVVPAGKNKLRPERVVVGWKDTRESRCAVLDALPLLKTAAHMVVVEIAAEDQLAEARARLKDVVAWLKRHGVEADPIAEASTEPDDSMRLESVAREQRADLIVAGA